MGFQEGKSGGQPFVIPERFLKEVEAYEKEFGTMSDIERKYYIEAMMDAELEKQIASDEKKMIADDLADADERESREYDAWKEERRLGEEGEARQKILDND